MLAVELANWESATSWRDFLTKLKQRGLRGVEFAVTDDHAGLKQGIAEVLPETAGDCLETVWPLRVNKQVITIRSRDRMKGRTSAIESRHPPRWPHA